MEERVVVRLGGGKEGRRISGFEAEALMKGRPGLFFPLSGYDERGRIRGWIDLKGMVPVTKAGEIPAFRALDVLEQLIYGLYEDMDLCLMPGSVALGIGEIYIDRSTWKIRAVFIPSARGENGDDPSGSIKRIAANAALGLIPVSEIRARGFLEQAARLLKRREMSLDRAVAEIEALKRRAHRLSGNGPELDFGNIFV